MLQPKDKDWSNVYKNKTPIYAAKRGPPQTQGHIQTESEGLEKDISCKWRPKESMNSNTHIRKKQTLVGIFCLFGWLVGF